MVPPSLPTSHVPRRPSHSPGPSSHSPSTAPRPSPKPLPPGLPCLCALYTSSLRRFCTLLPYIVPFPYRAGGRSRRDKPRNIKHPRLVSFFVKPDTWVGGPFSSLRPVQALVNGAFHTKRPLPLLLLLLLLSRTSPPKSEPFGHSFRITHLSRPRRDASFVHDNLPAAGRGERGRQELRATTPSPTQTVSQNLETCDDAPICCTCTLSTSSFSSSELRTSFSAGSSRLRLSRFCQPPSSTPGQSCTCSLHPLRPSIVDTTI